MTYFRASDNITWNAVCKEMIVNVIRLCQGFVDVEPAAAALYFGNVTEKTFVAKGVLYNAQTLILDGVVVSHRLSTYFHFFG